MLPGRTGEKSHSVTTAFYLAAQRCVILAALHKLYPRTCVRHFRRNHWIIVIRSRDGDFDTEKEENAPLSSGPCSDRTWQAFFKNFIYLFMFFFFSLRTY